MKKYIMRLKMTNITNETHAEFHRAFCAIANKYAPSTPDIGELYSDYLQKLDEEMQALDVIRRSALTGEIISQDRAREKLYSGMSGMVKAMLRHFSADKSAAAGRLKILFDNYGNIYDRSMDDRTSAIDDLIGELNGDYKPFADAISLSEWTAQMEIANQQFETLMSARYSEVAQRPAVRMREARHSVDRLFSAIIDRLEALATLNGTAGYAAFISETAAVIDRHRSILLAAAGRRRRA